MVSDAGGVITARMSVEERDLIVDTLNATIEVLGGDARNVWYRFELAALAFDFEDAEAEGTPS